MLKGGGEEKTLKELLSKLRCIRDEYGVGNKKITVNDKEADKNTFLRIKTILMEKYILVKGLIKERDDMESTGQNPKEVIVMSQRIRSELENIKNQFQQLTITLQSNGYSKSQLSREDLENHKEIVHDLSIKIDELLSLSSQRGNKKKGQFIIPHSFDTTSIAVFTQDDNTPQFGGPSILSNQGKYYKESEMSSVEKQGLLQIQQNRDEQDKVLEVLGEEVKGIKTLAIGISEEVLKQEYILKDIESQMHTVGDKLNIAIKGAKRLNKESNRGGDKLCMDLVCIMLIISALTLIYNIIQARITAA